jgi:hypothetical protein
MWKYVRVHVGDLLDVAIAFAAFAAAWYWYKASNAEIPALLNNWDREKLYDAFNAAMQTSSRLNGKAAIYSGSSAFLMGLKMALRDSAEQCLKSGSGSLLQWRRRAKSWVVGRFGPFDKPL